MLQLITVGAIKQLVYRESQDSTARPLEGDQILAVAIATYDGFIIQVGGEDATHLTPVMDLGQSDQVIKETIFRVAQTMHQQKRRIFDLLTAAAPVEVPHRRVHPRRHSTMMQDPRSGSFSRSYSLSRV